METFDEAKPDINDPPCEGSEESSLEVSRAEEEIGRLTPLPFPISTRPNLNSLTSGRPKTMKRRPQSRQGRMKQIPEVEVIPLAADDETTIPRGAVRALSERKQSVERESDTIQRFSSMRSPRTSSGQRPPSFLAELGKAQGEKARRAPLFLAELNKAQKSMNPAPKAMTSPTFHNELGSVFTRRLGGSNSGSSTGQVVNSWAKSKSSKKEEEKTKPAEGSGRSKPGEKEEGGNVRFGAKTNDVAQDLLTKESEGSPKYTLKARNSPQFLEDLGHRQRDINPAPIAMKSTTFHAALSNVNATKKEVGANPPENELANLWAKKRKNSNFGDESSKNQDPASTEEDTSTKRSSWTANRANVKKTTDVTPNPAENKLANIWARNKNLNATEEDKTERKDGVPRGKEVTGLGGRGQGSLRVLPSCVHASQEEDALLGASKLEDLQDTFEPAVRRQRPKSIKLGSTELSLEGRGGKGQALFRKMAQTHPE